MGSFIKPVGNALSPVYSSLGSENVWQSQRRSACATESPTDSASTEAFGQGVQASCVHGCADVADARLHNFSARFHDDRLAKEIRCHPRSNISSRASVSPRHELGFHRSRQRHIVKQELVCKRFDGGLRNRKKHCFRSGLSPYVFFIALTQERFPLFKGRAFACRSGFDLLFIPTLRDLRSIGIKVLLIHLRVVRNSVRHGPDCCRCKIERNLSKPLSSRQSVTAQARVRGKIFINPIRALLRQVGHFFERELRVKPSPVYIGLLRENLCEIPDALYGFKSCGGDYRKNTVCKVSHGIGKPRLFPK
ncbi:MAG: hypothetical protein EBY32_03945 [Proteobacteria bacterium]|nr:hypothetical protein [Pseudomonadota bacterium]